MSTIEPNKSDVRWSMPPAKRRPLRFLLIIVLVLSAAGCGVGEYEKRMAAGKQELAASSVYNQMTPPVAIGDTPVKIRVPKQIAEPAAGDADGEDTGDTDTDGSTDPSADGEENATGDQPPESEQQFAGPGGEQFAPEEIIQPLGVAVPGLRLTYEGHVTDSAGGRIPYYLYLAAADKRQRSRRAADLTTTIGYNLRSKFPEASTVWQPFQATTPDGGGMLWQRLRLEQPQGFRYINAEGDTQVVELPGVLDIYHRAAGDWFVTIAWRVPESIVESVQLSKWAPLVPGTLEAPPGTIADPASP